MSRKFKQTKPSKQLTTEPTICHTNNPRVARYMQIADAMYETLESAKLTDSEFDAIDEELMDQAGLKTSDRDDLMSDLRKQTGAKFQILIDDRLYNEYLADQEAA